MSKPLFLIFILNCCETMKILSSMIVIIILISSGCLGIFEGNVDNDNDGFLNDIDDFPNDPEEWIDTDGDGIGNNADLDDDNDGFTDSLEFDCISNSLNNSSKPIDLDKDGICDILDGDIDGDNLPNIWEINRNLNPFDANDSILCHGYAEYCLRSYDNFTFPETHNAYSALEDGVFMGVNHYTGLQAQWDGGIRAFMVDTHHVTSDNTGPEDVRFCHGSPNSFPHPCSYSEIDAFEWLTLLNSLMNSSGNNCPMYCGDVVTLLIENYVPAEHLNNLFNKTGMSDRIYIHSFGDVWPDIGDLILSGKDLVVFWEQTGNQQYPWLHDFGEFGWTTNYGEDNQDEMKCTIHRGNGSQPVWHLNHWLTSIFGVADPSRSNEVNDYYFLLNRSLECWEIMDNRPTFIAVDYWEDGEITNVTITLNKMEHWSSEIPPHP